MAQSHTGNSWLAQPRCTVQIDDFAEKICLTVGSYSRGTESERRSIVVHLQSPARCGRKLPDEATTRS